MQRGPGLLVSTEAARVEARLKDAYARWLEGMRWDFFVTPTFRYPTTQAQAASAVRQWLAVTAPSAYAAVAFEHGPMGGRLHCHAVIGGIGQHDAERYGLWRGWRRGRITVSPYTPALKGVRYMLKDVQDADGVELIGDPVPYRPRKRGRRGGSK